MTVSKETLRGFAFESTAENDPITSPDTDPNDKYWKYGVRIFDLKQAANLPNKTWVYFPIYKANDRMPTEIVKLRSDMINGFSYLPVNGIPEYMVMGKSTTGGTEHVIEHIKTGSLPTFTDRAESGIGGSQQRFMSAIGCKAYLCTTHLEVYKASGVLNQHIAYNGITSQQAALNAVHDSTKYPTHDGAMTGTETKTRFRWGDSASQVLTWNATAYKDHVLMYDDQILNNQFVKHIANQEETEFIDEGTYQVAFSMLLWRGEDDTIYDDYLSGTKRTLTFKIYAGATNYKQHVFTNAAILECVGPEDKEKAVWSVKGIAQKVVATVEDGLPATGQEYYGE